MPPDMRLSVTDMTLPQMSDVSLAPKDARHLFCAKDNAVAKKVISNVDQDLIALAECNPNNCILQRNKPNRTSHSTPKSIACPNHCPWPR